MALNPAYESALATLRNLISTETVPELTKSTMSALRRMGLETSPSGGAIMAKEIGKAYTPLATAGANYGLQQLASEERTTARKENQIFQAGESEKNRLWNEKMNALNLMEQKKSAKKAAKNALTQNLMQLGIGIATGGISGLLGVGGKSIGLLKGLLLGGPAVAQVGMQSLGTQNTLDQWANLKKTNPELFNNLMNTTGGK